MRDCVKRDKMPLNRRVLHWYDRKKVPWTSTHRYFFNPAYLEEHFEKYVHLKLADVEIEKGIEYTDSLKDRLNQFEKQLSPLVRFLFDGKEKPKAKDILDASRLDPELSHIVITDLCLILSQVGDAKAFLVEHDLESDLFNTLFYDNEDSSLQDAAFEYLIQINMSSSYAKKEQMIISKAVCDLMGSPNSRVNGILTLYQIGLTIDAFILSAVLCSSSTHMVIKNLIENKLPTYFPSMEYLRLVECLEYEKVCETFNYSTLNTVDPLLVYRFIRIALARLESETSDLKKKISGRMMLSALFQNVLLVSLLKKDGATVIFMLEDFWMHVPDNVLSDMFNNMERVFFCQVFQILVDIVEVMDYHTKNSIRSSTFEYSNNCFLSVAISNWLNKGWIMKDANNNDHENLIAAYTSTLSKFGSLIEDSRLKFCIKLALSLVRYETFSLKSELSIAFRKDENETNRIFSALRKNFMHDSQDQTLRTVLGKMETLLFN